MAPSRIDLDHDLAHAEKLRELALHDVMEHLESDYSGASTPGLYTGEGKDDAPRSPVRKPHKKNGSPKVNGVEHETDESRLVDEKQEDADGEHLTSVKPTAGFEVALRQGKKESLTSQKTEREELVSGRKAGAGWQRSGIRFAPLNVPLQRRLQTLLVLGHTLCIALFLMTFFFLCAVPIFWPILAPYLLYVLFSRAGTSGELSHRSERFRSSSIWSLFAGYFPARLHRSQTLPATRKYIFGYHPHGIISHGAFSAFATEALGFRQLFPGITNTLLTLDSNFRIPLYRDYALAMGLGSVSRESCENLLSKGGPNNEGMGRAITIVVGGARESLDARPRTLRLVLQRRKGFVKLAIRTGADLVPVLSFGENDLYDQLQPELHPLVHKLQLLFKKLMGFTIPLFHARGIFNYDVGMMPYRRPLNIVVGRPIKVMQQARPDEGYVDEIHELYTKELERLWDVWKDVFAKERTEELKIVY
ncbi:MAG: diacylglycerol O-acyltransferase 1 [Candelina mexicana]|nr:MAG: diacylglycerol O-acyltransferase 1 [Candelina mexicana]